MGSRSPGGGRCQLGSWERGALSPRSSKFAWDPRHSGGSLQQVTKHCPSSEHPLRPPDIEHAVPKTGTLAQTPRPQAAQVSASPVSCAHRA